MPETKKTNIQNKMLSSDTLDSASSSADHDVQAPAMKKRRLNTATVCMNLFFFPYSVSEICICLFWWVLFVYERQQLGCKQECSCTCHLLLFTYGDRTTPTTRPLLFFYWWIPVCKQTTRGLTAVFKYTRIK